MLPKRTLTTIGALACAMGVSATGAQSSADQNRAAARIALAPVYDAHARLATRFRSLWGDAIAERATTHDRVTFLRFLSAELLPHLDREGAVLYPVFDSLTAGGYAAPAALFDRQTIGRLVRELGDTPASRDTSEFKARSYAIAVSLETYFTKIEFLVLPVVHRELSEHRLRALLARL